MPKRSDMMLGFRGVSYKQVCGAVNRMRRTPGYFHFHVAHGQVRCVSASALVLYSSNSSFLDGPRSQALPPPPTGSCFGNVIALYWVLSFPLTQLANFHHTRPLKCPAGYVFALRHYSNRKHFNSTPCGICTYYVPHTYKCSIF